MKVYVRPTARTKATLALVRSWSKRFPRLQAQLVYAAAEWARRMIEEKLPKGDEWSGYRQSLETVKVLGAPKGMIVYSLRANPRSRRVKKEDAPRTVVYVRPRKQLRRPLKKVEILEKFSPWTLKTLPFMPKKSEAVLVMRRVTLRETQRVEKSRGKDRKKWGKELAKCGVRISYRDRKLQADGENVKAVPDLAFEAIRLEFGLGNISARPHWRPSIRQLAAIGLRSLIRQDPTLRRTLVRAGEKAWKKWPQKTRNKIRLGEAKNFLPFQRRLGIRI